MNKHPSNRGKIAVNRHQTQSKTSANNQERVIEKKTRQESQAIINQEAAAMPTFVIRAKYVQPNGIGWATVRAFVTHDPKQAARFDSESEAWYFLGLNHERLGGEDEDGLWSWPEEAVEYTPEELARIRDEHDERRAAYYDMRQALAREDR